MIVTKYFLFNHCFSKIINWPLTIFTKLVQPPEAPECLMGQSSQATRGQWGSLRWQINYQDGDWILEKTAPEFPIETSWARIVINKHRKFSFWGDAGEDAHQDREFLLLHAGKAPSPKLRERLAQKQQQSPAQCFQLGLFSRDTSQEKENQWGKGQGQHEPGVRNQPGAHAP